MSQKSQWRTKNCRDTDHCEDFKKYGWCKFDHTPAELAKMRKENGPCPEGFGCTAYPRCRFEHSEEQCVVLDEKMVNRINTRTAFKPAKVEEPAPEEPEPFKAKELMVKEPEPFKVVSRAPDQRIDDIVSYIQAFIYNLLVAKRIDKNTAGKAFVPTKVKEPAHEELAAIRAEVPKVEEPEAKGRTPDERIDNIVGFLRAFIDQLQAAGSMDKVTADDFRKLLNDF